MIFLFVLFFSFFPVLDFLGSSSRSSQIINMFVGVFNFDELLFIILLFGWFFLRFFPGYFFSSSVIWFWKFCVCLVWWFGFFGIFGCDNRVNVSGLCCWGPHICFFDNLGWSGPTCNRHLCCIYPIILLLFFFFLLTFLFKNFSNWEFMNLLKVGGLYGLFTMSSMQQ